MSTRCTILITDNNEHWYEDVIDREIVLSFSAEHLIVDDGDGEFSVVIKENTSLYEALLNTVWPEQEAARKLLKEERSRRR